MLVKFYGKALFDVVTTIFKVGVNTDSGKERFLVGLPHKFRKEHIVPIAAPLLNAGRNFSGYQMALATLAVFHKQGMRQVCTFTASSSIDSKNFMVPLKPSPVKMQGNWRD